MALKSTRRQALKAMAALSVLRLPVPNRLHSFVEQDRISMAGSSITIENDAPSYLEYAVRDLATYVGELSGHPMSVARTSSDSGHSTLVVGRQLAEKLGVTPSADLAEEGFVIQTVPGAAGTSRIVVAGNDAKGTRQGVIALMRTIRCEGDTAFVPADFRVQSKPRFSVRALHLNGWAFDYPYSFRSWQEKDWESFIDMTAYQGVNLFFLWPFMEIMPVPLSQEDEAYLHEVRRVVDYAHRNHGMEMWIMHSPNRIATSTCDSPDPRRRPYWVTRCQSDMNPAVPDQYKRIVDSLEVLYRIVNNADGFGMIDSDPGGWPQSPLSDQLKIFAEARRLLDQYNEKGRQAKLVDWMWIGWGRHKYFNSSRTVVAEYDWSHDKNPDADDVAFMEKTIEGFRNSLHEPWWLIAGFPPYLKASQHESVLNKTVFMPYGAIEGEPSFPMTNIPLEPVRKQLILLGEYPGVAGIMGNNMTPLIQIPRTYYLLTSAWTYDYRTKNEKEVLHDLAQELYVDDHQLIADAYLALEATDPGEIGPVLSQLEARVRSEASFRPGVLGRKLFPKSNQVVDDLVSQLKIRKAEQAFISGIDSKVTLAKCSELTENYLDQLLAWDRRTGWQKMVDIGIWRGPVYATSDKSFMHAMAGLKGIISEGYPLQSTYDRVAQFFQPIGERLSSKYGSNAAMISCVEPMKLAVIQSAS